MGSNMDSIGATGTPAADALRSAYGSGPGSSSPAGIRVFVDMVGSLLQANGVGWARGAQDRNHRQALAPDNQPSAPPGLGGRGLVLIDVVGDVLTVGPSHHRNLCGSNGCRPGLDRLGTRCGGFDR